MKNIGKAVVLASKKVKRELQNDENVFDPGLLHDVVRHSPQELSEAQKAQARKNIGAVPFIGEGAPTTATVGAVGCFYMDTLTGDVWKCVSADGGVYGWELFGSGSPDAVKYTPQDLTEEQKAQARENIGAGTAEEKLIIGTSLSDVSMKLSSKMKDADAIESFIFFADPHLLNSIDNEAQMREYLNVLKIYYDTTPTSFVISGGDWYGNSDTRDQACFKLGYIDGWMNRLFGNKHYPVVGNHDTNQQGVDETGDVWTGILSKETVRNLWYREIGNTYYAFSGANTRFYVLDSWKEGTDNSYYWEQIAWLGEKLKADNPVNAAIVMHIAFTNSNGVYTPTVFSSNAMALCEAYNNATTITLNAVTYDFSECTGKVRFALSGHIHSDHSDVINGIPLIATTHMRDGGAPTFDICLANYTSNALDFIRVGSGYDRRYGMGPDGSIIDIMIAASYGISDEIVSLPMCNHNGAGINYYDRPARMLIVSVAETEVPFSVGTGETDVTHYALKAPDGATAVTVSWDSNENLGAAFISVKMDGTDSCDIMGRWMTNGEEATLPTDWTGYYYLRFHKADESAFSRDYDASHIKWTFK